MDDTFYMQLALDLAKRGIGFTSPNPVVGAVVVKNGEIVGKGYHRKAGGAHAETNAIKNAGELAEGAALFVNLEPCNHSGRTPPCTRSIVAAGIRRVVAAMADPNPDVEGEGIAYLRDKGLDVSLGICEEDARKLNEAFIKYVKTKRPFVTVKCAMTLDGRIATKSGDSKWITGEEARSFVHEMRHASDAIMVGVNTVKKDNPRLTTRLGDKKDADPKRVILDTHLTIPEDATILQIESDSVTMVITGAGDSDTAKIEKQSRLEQMGTLVLQSPLQNGLLAWDPLMARLGGMGITSLMIEGGSRVIGSALRAGIVDKIVFFYAPRV
ncbi:MAG: bifunctional diaminohydroxyphosphoribosylaminopyrimidine deaminase/5-amino-6-(5-phosphoribosylamino)uracil reductase RibD, partial [Desulfobacterales bacterium]